MKNLAPTIDDRLAVIEACDDVDLLKRELCEGLTMSLDGYRLAVASLRRLKEKGEDVSICFESRHVQRLFERMAAGALLVEFWYRFKSNLPMLRQAATLTPEEQSRIARNEPLPLYYGTGDHRMVRPFDMTPEEIQQVFDRDGIRGEREQISFVLAAADRQAVINARTAERQPSYRVEKSKKRIYFSGEGYITATELKRILRDFA